MNPDFNINLPSCTSPRWLIIFFPVCSLYFLYLLWEPCCCMYVASTATCWQKKYSLSAPTTLFTFLVSCGRFSKDLLYTEMGKQAIRGEERERQRAMATKRIRERETEWEERSEDDKRTRQQHQSRSEETRLGNNIKALNEGQQRRRQELEWQQRHMQVCVCACVYLSIHVFKCSYTSRSCLTDVSLWDIDLRRVPYDEFLCVCVCKLYVNIVCPCVCVCVCCCALIQTGTWQPDLSEREATNTDGQERRCLEKTKRFVELKRQPAKMPTKRGRRGPTNNMFS